MDVGAATFKFSGLAKPGEERHAVRSTPGNTIAPTQVQIPGGHYVNQYAPTVVGDKDVYDPAGDCNGSFMSSKFQPHNNCYAYGCDIATNSFPQPGRIHGILLNENFTGDAVQAAAEKDGLIEVSKEQLTPAQLEDAKKNLPPGHFVALLFSQPDQASGWPGDYHWCRQDKDGTWSQKDGGDAVTNFDFAGNKITDPAKANWTVNQGPISNENPSDLIVGYDFHSYMFVPDGKVNII